MKQPPYLLAILGRGIQRPSEDGPWVLTEDLEVCDDHSAHRRVRVPVDDINDFCMIGGGEANLLAGMYLIEEHAPEIVVCAYGHRAAYLEPDGPTESEVMGKQLLPRLPPGTELVTWVRDRYPEPLVPSNTRQEMLNVLDLAVDRGISHVVFVAIGVHMPRAATYLSKHLSVYPDRYKGITAAVLETEEVLLHFDRELYGPRVERIRKSLAFKRNWVREADGIWKIVCDEYGDAKPKVEVELKT